MAVVGVTPITTPGSTLTGPRLMGNGPIEELASVLVVIGPCESTSSMKLVIRKSSGVFVTVFERDRSFAVPLTTFELALIDIAIGPSQLSISVHFAAPMLQITFIYTAVDEPQRP